MTARRRLIPLKEVGEALDFLKTYGIDPAKCGVDIMTDGVRVYPPANSAGAGTAFDHWKSQDPHGDPAPRR